MYPSSRLRIRKPRLARMSRRPRNIVICFDGTKETPTMNNTNVIRIFKLAAGKARANLTYYCAGIGTLPRPGSFRFFLNNLGRTFGAASGHGMIDNVGSAYSFLNDNYRHDDRLFFFGFSRGAYTARLLASVIHQIGLLPAGHDHLTAYALNLAFAGRAGEAERFSQKLTLRKPRVNFLGLFDCVKSTVFEVDAVWNPLRLTVPYSWYNDDVMHVRHAIAIDERRAFFSVNRWADNSTRPGTESDGRTVKQVWFAGDHCDVGGGHTESGLDLSVVPLVWMVKEARSAGLPLAEIPSEIFDLAADYKGLATIHCHNMARGIRLLAELLPTFSANDDDEGRLRLMNLARGRFIPYRGRQVLVHASVRERLLTGKSANGGLYSPMFLKSAEGSIEWVS
jgi:uncharacterized protein (DUF2235 family)